MDETDERQNEKSLNGLLTHKKYIDTLRKNHCKLYTMSHDSSSLVSQPKAKKLIKVLRSAGTQWLCLLLKEQLRKFG